DRRRHVGRNVEVARAAAVLAVRRAVPGQPGRERVLHPYGRASEDDAAPSRARLADVQAVLGREILDRGEVLSLRAVAGGELAPAEVAAFAERLRSELI